MIENILSWLARVWTANLIGQGVGLVAALAFRGMGCEAGFAAVCGEGIAIAVTLTVFPHL